MDGTRSSQTTYVQLFLPDAEDVFEQLLALDLDSGDTRALRAYLVGDRFLLSGLPRSVNLGGYCLGLLCVAAQRSSALARLLGGCIPACVADAAEVPAAHAALGHRLFRSYTPDQILEFSPLHPDILGAAANDLYPHERPQVLSQLVEELKSGADPTLDCYREVVRVYREGGPRRGAFGCALRAIWVRPNRAHYAEEGT